MVHPSASLALIAATYVLIGCGAEVATTAVTASKLQASQAEQATAQADKIKAAIGQAAQNAEVAASAATGQ